MLKISKIVTTVLAVCGMVRALTIDISHAAQTNSAPSSESPPFTTAQEARIGEVAANYLVAHPDVLVRVSEKLQEQQQARILQDMANTAILYQSELLHDKGTPSYGPTDASVVVTEFFDYQCVYCSKLAPIMTELMKANPQVRFVFREWPIFGNRWPASQEAARTGLFIWQQKGAQAYLKYHNGIYATGHNEGNLTMDDIRKVAGKIKADPSKTKAVIHTLDSTNALAQQVGFRGTPALIVMPVTGASADNTTVLPGMTDTASLQTAISKASGTTTPQKP